MFPARSRLSRALTVATVVLTVALASAACTTGGGATTAPAAPTEAPAAPTEAPAVPTEAPASVPAASPEAGGTICQDVAALESAITALGQVDLQAGGTAALAAAVANVKTAAEALKGSASSELSDVATTFAGEVETLKQAVDQLGEGDGSGLLALGAAIASLVSSAQELEAQFRSACP